MVETTLKNNLFNNRHSDRAVEYISVETTTYSFYRRVVDGLSKVNSAMELTLSKVYGGKGSVNRKTSETNKIDVLTMHL